MHAGHLSVDPEHHGTLFFWHFASKHTSDKPRTVIWLNGGPGASSLVGAWTEIGPFRFQDENTIIENNGSWHLFVNLLFIDQPVGTGFSYIDNDSFIHELDEVVNHFVSFLDRYIEVFPELLQNDIYLAGESFAAQYIPYIAHEILAKRSNLKLRGLLIGNGWIDPVTIYELYLPFAVANNLVKINSVLYDIISSQVRIWLPEDRQFELSPIGHSPMAKVQGCVGEGTVDFRQLTKFQGMYWRKYSGHSPIDESIVEFCHPSQNNINTGYT
ncbi:unnamed protein product [Rotaria sp. Silwood1]|nr:unnamed protein product [Rotaria sp. Silwood1]